MGNLKFISQPGGAAPLGTVLLEALEDPAWTGLRAAVAYVKASGVRHLSGPLQQFLAANPGNTKIVVGIDQQGSSLEAVEELFLVLSEGHGELFILRNPAGSPSPTFHPKFWYFTNPTASKGLLISGSGNLTEGGLYSNYEVGTAVILEAQDPVDALAIAAVTATFTEWTNSLKPHVQRVDVATLQSLHDSGELPSEDMIRRASRIARSATARMAAGDNPNPISGLFKGTPTKRAPAPAMRAALPVRPVKRRALIAAAAPSSVVPPPATVGRTVASPAFVPIHHLLRMTVRPQQKTELYLTKGVLDQDPAFFGAPFTGLTTPKILTNQAQPQPDPLPTVSLTVFGVGGSVVATEPTHVLKMWTYTNGPSANGDFRLTLPAEMLQQVPNDTILVMERDPMVQGLDYALRFYPPGHPDYPKQLAGCTERIRNSSRRYGWE